MTLSISSFRTWSKQPVVCRVAKFTIFPVLATLCILTVQYFWLRGLQQYPTLDLGTFSQVVSGKINADILVLGSSRAQHHFDPRILSRFTKKSAYNIGLDGTGIDLQAALFFTYLRHNQKPEFLILSLDIPNLARRLDSSVYHPGQYVAYLEEPSLFLALKQHNSEWSLYKRFPFIGIAKFISPLTSGNEQLRYEAIRSLLKRPLPESLFNGFAPVDKNWTAEFDDYKKQHPNGMTYEIYPENIKTIHALLMRCKQSGINLILVYSPEYYENQLLTNNRQDIILIYEGIAKEFNIPFWDYSDSVISHEKGNFYNSQHLNVRGASRFTEDLALRLHATIQANRGSISTMESSIKSETK